MMPSHSRVMYQNEARIMENILTANYYLAIVGVQSWSCFCPKHKDTA